MQASFIVEYIEPLITLTALFFTVINWIISQRLNAFNQKLSLFEKSFSNTVQIAIIGMTYLLVSELKFSIIALYMGLGGILGWFGVMKVGYRASRIAEHTSKEIGSCLSIQLTTSLKYSLCFK